MQAGVETSACFFRRMDMLQIEKYVETLINRLRLAFGRELLYVGQRSNRTWAEFEIAVFLV